MTAMVGALGRRTTSPLGAWPGTALARGYVAVSAAVVFRTAVFLDPLNTCTSGGKLLRLVAPLCVSRGVGVCIRLGRRAAAGGDQQLDPQHSSVGPDTPKYASMLEDIVCIAAPCWPTVISACYHTHNGWRGEPDSNCNGLYLPRAEGCARVDHRSATLALVPL